jgi:CheY-specific phosphatase CheX
MYKVKNDTRIELSGKWVEVAREDMVGDSTVFYLNDVRKILGQNGELYGYIVYSYNDNAFIKIIDAKTVKLIYVHQVQEGR